MEILAIDPGNIESAYVVLDTTTCRPLTFGKVGNLEVLDLLAGFDGGVHIEMIASYGMAVGAEVFDTCVWIGRFSERSAIVTGRLPELVKRQPIKLHHCHSSKAKDANIIQALVDRFGADASNRGKGTKAEPGWFYGFRADVWQAYALAVYVADTAMVPA